MRTHETRLVLAQRPTRREHLHGAWWPRTTDLDQELAPMLALINERFGAVFGIMLNRDEWPDAEVTGPGVRIGKAKLSWYGLAEPHQAVLRCHEARRIALLLIPPDTPERIALTATLMACAPGNTLTTDETLTRARAEAPSSHADGVQNVSVQRDGRT